MMLRHLVLLLISIFGTDGFITHNNCPAPSPCRCYSTFISCSNKHLTRIPAFTSNSWTEDKLTIFLVGNELTFIQANAFRGLRFRRQTTIDLRLDINHLYSIEHNAFLGIMDKVVSINLDNNNFITVPAELATLRRLEHLTILRNPLISLDAGTMFALGTHLASFYIDLQGFATWPIELQNLLSLKELHINDVNMNTIDVHAFDGMNDLTTIKMDNTSLTSIPGAIAKLPVLKSFTLSRSKYLTLSEQNVKMCPIESLNASSTANISTNATDMDTCPTSQISYVEISRSSLRYIDDIFNIFTSVENLTLSYNNISFIYWNDVNGNTSLVNLDISHNNLTRVPSALNKMTTLLNIDLQYNRIVSVEDFDIFRLANLQVLTLSHNPLEYISPSAFENNVMLTSIQLHDTQLRFLPQSLSGLNNLKTLSLPYETVECTCSMASLKTWDVSQMSISGYCKTSYVRIRDYIEKDLRNC